MYFFYYDKYIFKNENINYNIPILMTFYGNKRICQKELHFIFQYYHKGLYNCFMSRQNNKETIIV